MGYSHSKTASDKCRFVIETDGTNKGTKMIEIQGKKRALKAAGFPTYPLPAQPNESRWGSVITYEQAETILRNGE